MTQTHLLLQSLFFFFFWHKEHKSHETATINCVRIEQKSSEIKLSEIKSAAVAEKKFVAAGQQRSREVHVYTVFTG